MCNALYMDVCSWCYWWTAQFSKPHVADKLVIAHVLSTGLLQLVGQPCSASCINPNFKLNRPQNQCTKGFVHYTSLRGTWMAIWMWPSPVWSQNRHSPTTRREWTVRDTLSLSHHTWSFYPYWIADVCYWAGDLKLLWKYTSWSLHLNWSPCVEE